MSRTRDLIIANPVRMRPKAMCDLTALGVGLQGVQLPRRNPRRCATGGNYDATRFGYDTMGRRWRVKGADGTISRTVFDELGRATESWTGTNDVSFSGGEPSGTDNMVKTATTTNDGGSAGGNSLVTSRTLDADGNWGTTTDQRVTSYTYDARGRAVVITNPQAPHVLSKYDAMGRTVATGLYSSAGSLTITSDPTTVSSSRMGLSQTFYDERGQVWKSQRHKIDDADGSDDDNLQTLMWYDAAGRTINALGQEMWKKDQAGNILETDYDTAGRISHKRATTINTAGGFDDAVKRITLAYDTLGRTSTVTQYDHATAGSGSVLDEVKYTYEDWGNIEKIEQDRDGAVGGGTPNDYEVAWTYAKAVGGRNTIRRDTLALPGGGAYTYYYGTGINADASRVYQVQHSTGTPYATYSYNGVGQVVRTYLEEPDAFYDQDGTTARTYTDLDRFNRVIGSAWTKDLSTDRDFYSLTLNYDRNSNITDITDNVLKAGVAGNRNFDVQYGIDNLNRVTRADEGTFASGSISNRSRDEQWTLTQTGNWDRAKVDLNGDGDFTDAGETDDTRTHNVANEILTRDTDTNGTANYTLTHDAVGNLTDDGQSYKFVYDVWGRVRMIKNQSNNLVAEYRYNGLNQRLSWHYDTDADGDCDSNDKTYYFAYDDQWRVVATYRESDSSPKERLLYHAAGLGGYGGASGGIGGYIDHRILRDKDANTAWDVASDATLEERIYYCQNWRADVSAILTSSGKMVEWAKYSAYGTPTALPTGDTDSDGDYDINDLGNMGGGYEIRKDAELDGDVDANDINYAIANGYQTLGRGVLSSSYVGNRKGYAGYENDGAIVRFAHVRNRVLDSTLGRWTRRDPIGYVDGMGLYQYVRGHIIILTDALGLVSPPVRPIHPEWRPIPENPPFDPGPVPPLPQGCPQGQVFVPSVGRCIPINYVPPRTPGSGRAPRPDENNPDVNAWCAWACDQSADATGAAFCYNDQPVICNCTRRRFPRGGGYVDALSRCTDQCEPLHFERIDCTGSVGQGAPWTGIPACSECYVNACIASCFGSYDCNQEPPNNQAGCEFVKKRRREIAEEWCVRCFSTPVQL